MSACNLLVGHLVWRIPLSSYATTRLLHTGVPTLNAYKYLVYAHVQHNCTTVLHATFY